MTIERHEETFLGDRNILKLDEIMVVLLSKFSRNYLILHNHNWSLFLHVNYTSIKQLYKQIYFKKI